MPLALLSSRAGSTPPAPPAASASPAHTRLKRVLILAVTAVVTLLWAALGSFLLDFSTWTVKPREQWTGPLHTGGFVPNILVLWLVVLLVLAVVGRLWVTLGITGVLAVTVAAINATKLALRNDTLRTTDMSFLSQPGFLVEMVGGAKVLVAVLIILAVVLASWLIGRLVHRWLPHVGSGLSRGKARMLLAVRVLVAVTCLGLLWSAGNFNDPGNPWHRLYDATGLRWRKFDQRSNYLRNGFVAGLLYNTHIQAMAKPPGYSRATMQQLARKYADLAASMNRGRTGDLSHTNVVTVLSESFSQPLWLNTVRWPENPIPRTTALMQRTVSGKMLAPGYGGGTANTEFEVLTGQSLSVFRSQVSSAYEQIVPNYDRYPSAVQWFTERGHYPIAMHPFEFRMYKRPQVFDTFGFQKLIDRSKMRHRAHADGGRYISDASAFDEVLDQMHQSTKPVFMHLITMQNHMPFDKQYDDPIRPTHGFGPAKTELAGQYARGIRITDEALAGFIAKLRKEPEPTVLLFYGDHLPGEAYLPTMPRREGPRVSHETPFLIWTNQHRLAPRPLPTVSPVQFMPLLFDAMDAPVPPYYALLDRLRTQLPAMDAGVVIDGDDRMTHPKDLDPAQRQILRDFRLVQYDLSIGKRYTAATMFGDPPR